MEIKLVEKHLVTLPEGPLRKQLENVLAFAKNRFEKIAEIIGKVFVKTSTLIAGEVPAEDATIESLLQEFVDEANGKGITNVYVDPDVRAWFPQEEVARTVAKPSRLLRFVKTITHADIISGCKKLDAYEEYVLSEGIRRATALVKAGELDKSDNTGVIIYLTNRRNGTPCRLFMWLDGGGGLSLGVRKVDLGSKWGAGGGVLVSNEPFGE